MGICCSSDEIDENQSFTNNILSLKKIPHEVDTLEGIELELVFRQMRIGGFLKMVKESKDYANQLSIEKLVENWRSKDNVVY